ALHVFRVRPPIRDEAVCVWHSHFRQCLRVKDGLPGYDVVDIKKEGHDRVHLIGSEALRRSKRHGATNVVENRRGIGPIAANGPHWSRRSKRPPTASELIEAFRRVLPLLTVARRTLLRVNSLALLNGASTRRQSQAIGSHVHVPSANLIWRGGGADAEASMLPGSHVHPEEPCEGQRDFKRSHW